MRGRQRAMPPEPLLDREPAMQAYTGAGDAHAPRHAARSRADHVFGCTRSCSAVRAACHRLMKRVARACRAADQRDVNGQVRSPRTPSARATCQTPRGHAHDFHVRTPRARRVAERVGGAGAGHLPVWKGVPSPTPHVCAAPHARSQRCAHPCTTESGHRQCYGPVTAGMGAVGVWTTCKRPATYRVG